jgi:hypothetical protein
LRWIAKGLQRPIFIITPKTKNSTITFLTVRPGSATTFEPKIKLPSAKVDSYGQKTWRTWWHGIEQEAIGQKQAPIILIHEGANHYSTIMTPIEEQRTPRTGWAQSTLNRYVGNSTKDIKARKRARSVPRTPIKLPQATLNNKRELLETRLRSQDEGSKPWDQSPLRQRHSRTGQEERISPNDRPSKRQGLSEDTKTTPNTTPANKYDQQPPHHKRINHHKHRTQTPRKSTTPKTMTTSPRSTIHSNYPEPRKKSRQQPGNCNRTDEIGTRTKDYNTQSQA